MGPASVLATLESSSCMGEYPKGYSPFLYLLLLRKLVLRGIQPDNSP